MTSLELKVRSLYNIDKHYDKLTVSNDMVNILRELMKGSFYSEIISVSAGSILCDFNKSYLCVRIVMPPK